IEIKQTAVPLGARRRPTGEGVSSGPKEKPGPVRRGEAVARPLRREDQPAAAQTTEPERTRTDEQSAEVRRGGDGALQTMSRIEDLCRRAQALHERTSAAPPEPTITRLRSTTGAVQLIERVHDRTRREKTVARLFGVRRAGSRVLFVQPIELGVDVRIAGDFNGWSPTATPMRRNEALGVHELTLDDLSPGRHAYRLVVDGRWLEDQFNPLTEPNEFGERNSIVIV
ncbi:MAG TPA: hypothetical protein ENK11_04175, partial [Phycisphaerales bacterium]|nr:hypothetical protein [Phycisphaerales bacterium]